MKRIPQWLQREEVVLGTEAVQTLMNKKIAVFGLGGVGSYVVEALARAGVGELILIDGDVVDETNINRQLVATTSSIGKPKTDIMKMRVLDINPKCRVTTYFSFFGPEMDASFLDSCDFVADAIDMVSAKVILAKYCTEKHIPILCAMGCGNKLDPSAFQITDITKTKVDPLCRVMRRELRLVGVEHLPVLYSEEKAVESKLEMEERVLGSVSFVPSVAGLMMAGYMIKSIVKEEP